MPRLVIWRRVNAGARRLRLRWPGGPDVWVELLETRRGGLARLLIEGPREVQVKREELLPPDEVPAAAGG